MSVKRKLIVRLVLLMIVDAIFPIPILGLVLLYVVLEKPPWFADLFHEIYQPGDSKS